MVIKMKRDVKDNGQVLLKANKEYSVKKEEESKNPDKVIIVVDSEIPDNEVLIEVDKE